MLRGNRVSIALSRALAALVVVGALSTLALGVVLARDLHNRPSQVARLRDVPSNGIAIASDPFGGWIQPATETTVSLTVEIVGVDLQKRELQTVIGLSVGEGVRRQIFFVVTGLADPAGATKQQSQEAITKFKAVSNETVTIRSGDGSLGADDLHLTLGELIGFQGTVLPTFVRQYSLVGVAEQYPDDTYQAQIAIDSQLSSAHALAPITNSVVRSPNLPESLDLRQQSYFGALISVSRYASFRTLIYLLCFTPLLLLMLVPSVVVFSPASRESKTAVFGVLAPVILSILPLRFVLVPPEITGFSTVDLFLAMELLLMTFVTVISFFAQEWRPVIARFVMRLTRHKS